MGALEKGIGCLVIFAMLPFIGLIIFGVIAYGAIQGIQYALSFEIVITVLKWIGISLVCGLVIYILYECGVLWDTLRGIGIALFYIGYGIGYALWWVGKTIVEKIKN